MFYLVVATKIKIHVTNNLSLTENSNITHTIAAAFADCTTKLMHKIRHHTIICMVSYGPYLRK